MSTTIAVLRCQEHDPARGPFEVTTPSFLRTDSHGNVGQRVMRVGETRRSRLASNPSQHYSRNSAVQRAVKKLASRQQRHRETAARDRVFGGKGLTMPGSLNPHKGW